LEEAQATVEAKTAPRLTKDLLEKRIKAVRYFLDGTLTICVIEAVNGFKVVGTAAPASEANFDPGVGQRYAYEDAFRQLWPLEGYALRSHLASAGSLLDDNGRAGQFTV
jgi:hypothetical protein